MTPEEIAGLIDDARNYGGVYAQQLIVVIEFLQIAAAETVSPDAPDRWARARAERDAERRRAEAAEAEVMRLRAALEAIAFQKLIAEADHETASSGDYEGAYDIMIGVARATLAAAPR